jgi:hypothetical protein
VRTKETFDFGLPYNGMNNVLVTQKNVAFRCIGMKFALSILKSR